MGNSFSACSIACPAPVKNHICAVCAVKPVEPSRIPRPDFSCPAPATPSGISSSYRHVSSSYRCIDGAASAPAYFSSGGDCDGDHGDCRVSTPPVCEVAIGTVEESKLGKPEPTAPEAGRCRSSRSSASAHSGEGDGRIAHAYRSEGTKSAHVGEWDKDSSRHESVWHSAPPVLPTTPPLPTPPRSKISKGSKSPPCSPRRGSKSPRGTGRSHSKEGSGRSHSKDHRADSVEPALMEPTPSESRSARRRHITYLKESEVASATPDSIGTKSAPLVFDKSMSDPLRRHASSARRATSPAGSIHGSSRRTASAGSGRRSPSPAACAAASSSSAIRRTACPKGTRCRRQRDEMHLAEEAHPFDSDYAEICRVTGVEPEQPSLRGLFEWVDVDDSGKISLAELQAALPLLEKLSGERIRLTAKSWERLDEDGNGCVNFSEFAAWAGPRLGLPLGVKHLFNVCSILGCPCQKFEIKETRKPFKSSMIAKENAMICKCGHKRACHDDVAPSGLEVPYPAYWDMQVGDFSKLIPVDTVMLQTFQNIMNDTYQNIWTRDRKKHNPDSPNVPKNYQIIRAWRSESSKYWQEYSVRRAELRRCRIEEGVDPDFKEYSDVKSVKAWNKFAGSSADRLRPECNEWYLFHGTSPQAAEKICEGDFKICLAGSSTGTLYGRGCYFAESVTKADEYAKANSNGERALLLCRALGGRVKYTDQVEPDPEELVDSCIEGPYDCILGDREKCKNTFREFIFYDTENVYAEYVIHYRRIY